MGPCPLLNLLNVGDLLLNKYLRNSFACGGNVAMRYDNIYLLSPLLFREIFILTDRTKEMCTSLSYAPRLTGLEGHDRIQHKLYTSITGPKVKAKFPSSIENKTGLFVCLFVFA